MERQKKQSTKYNLHVRAEEMQGRVAAKIYGTDRLRVEKGG